MLQQWFAHKLSRLLYLITLLQIFQDDSNQCQYRILHKKQLHSVVKKKIKILWQTQQLTVRGFLLVNKQLKKNVFNSVLEIFAISYSIFRINEIVGIEIKP